MNSTNLKKTLQFLKGESKSSDWMINIREDEFESTMTFLSDFAENAEMRNAWIRVGGIFSCELHSMESYSLSANNKENHIKAKFKVEAMRYFVSWVLLNFDEMSTEKIKEYVEFRRNRAFRHIIENPPRMNSTCIYSNLDGLYNNAAICELIEEVFEPLVLALNGVEVDKMLTLNQNFG